MQKLVILSRSIREHFQSMFKKLASLYDAKGGGEGVRAMMLILA